jgi:predicted AAA+ superfamily ATPase
VLTTKNKSEKFDFNDLTAFENIQNYREAIRLICNSIVEKRFPMPTNRSLTKEEKTYLYYLKLYLPIVNEKVTNKAIKNYIIYENAWRIMYFAKKKNDEEFYKLVMTYLTGQHLKDDLKRIYKEKELNFLGLGKGRISPKFKNYENYKGGAVSLDDLKGKYVFINAWAPC